MGMWFTYGWATIVAMVFSTARSPNSYKQCSSQTASRSKYGPLRNGFRKATLLVCAIPALRFEYAGSAGRIQFESLAASS